jgi:DNA-binding MarR family transcriptional regulator
MKQKIISPKRPRKVSEKRRCSENLGRMVKGYRALLEDALRDESLTLPQLKLLKAIKEQTGVSAAALARTCHVTPQTMQSILTRAVREQWIVRSKSVDNNRILTASLTPLGEEVLERGSQMAARIEEILWRGIGNSTLQQLNQILEAGIANLEQELNLPPEARDDFRGC